MKDTYYFPHDYHARNNLKIDALLADHGPAGYGIFWMIIEILHENEDHSLRIINGSYKALAKQMSTSVEHIEAVLKSCIDYELLYEDENGLIRSDRVDKNIDARAEISKKRSKAGKVSAEKRLNATSVEQGSTGVEQVSTKERKGKENKVCIDAHTDLGWNKEETLYNGLLKNYPKLFKFKKPLTYDQHYQLVNKFSTSEVKQIYTEMENYAPLLKKSESAYLTATNWLNRRKNDK